MSLSARLQRPGLRHGAAARAATPVPAARARTVARAGEKSVEEMLAEANALLNAVAGGSAPSGGASPPPGVQESIEGLTAMGFVCDESGCVLVRATDTIDEEAVEVATKFMSGRGWSLGMLESPDEDAELPAVVSGGSWTVPLSEAELSEFLTVLQQLRYAVANLHGSGGWLPAAGDRPVSRAKWQSRHVGMQATWAASDSQPAFSIDMTFRTDRRPVFTSWPADAVAAVCAALDGAAAPNGAAAAAEAPKPRVTASA